MLSGNRKLGKSATITPSANVASLPGDFHAIRSISSTISPYILSPVSSEILRSSYKTSGTGMAYAIDSTGILLSPDAGSQDITLDYWITPTVMSESTTTNELFPLFSEMYFYAALVEGNLYIGADPSLFDSKYQNALVSAIGSDKAARYGSGLRVVAA